jgi:hypothetical protein
MMKKITLLAFLLASTLNYAQSPEIANLWKTDLETTNSCDPNLGKEVFSGTYTFTTDVTGPQHFNVSWLFKGPHTNGSGSLQNKKVPHTSTIADIMSLTGAGSIVGLNTTATNEGSSQVISLGTACTSVEGAKIFASIAFDGFLGGSESETLTFTTNPTNALDVANFKQETFTVVINYGTTASVDQLEKFNFSFSPNPSKNFIKVSAANNIENVEIYNLIGQKVLSKNLSANNENINISDLAKGVYVMNVTIDGLKGSFKIIKE